MVKILKWIIDNYYLIFVFLGLWTFIGFREFQSFLLPLFVFVFLLVIANKSFKYISMDILIYVFIAYQLISVFFSDYSVYIWYLGIKNQVIPILFYFIGRSVIFSDNNLIKNMKIPLLFAFISALILYFWHPGWYIARKMANLTSNVSDQAFYENTRLSGFWSWSYTMGYSSLFFLMYYFVDIFKEKVSRITYLILAIALLVLFFAQQRATIAYLFLYIAFLTVVGPKAYKKKLGKIWIFLIFAIIGVTVFILNYSDQTYIDYVLNRTFNSDTNIVAERIETFSSFWNVSLFGDGLARYGHDVLQFNMKSITDCEYIRMMAELGIVGCFILFFIFYRTIKRGLEFRKNFFFEVNVILFYLVAMIGAAPFETLAMQPFLFWYCMGRIFNPNLLYNNQNFRTI